MADHPGAVPDVVLDDLVREIGGWIALLEDSFDFGVYKTIRRAQQLSAQGLIVCKPWIETLSKLNTSLRFKFSILSRAIMKAIKMSQRKISTGSFTVKTFSRAAATMLLVVCAHARTMVLNENKLKTAQAQLTSKTEQNKLKILAYDISKAIGTQPPKSISQESLSTPRRRQLAPQSSRVSSLMTSDEEEKGSEDAEEDPESEEEDPENASDDADAVAKVPLCAKRGALKVLHVI